MPTAVLADDEPHMGEALREQLGVLWPDLEILADATDGPQALLHIERLRPDLAFLDIRMPGLTGLQVARAMTSPSRVVFVTAFDSHALEAFEASAVDYVLKPIEVERLARCVSKLKRDLAPSPAHLDEALVRLGVSAPAASSPRPLQWLQVSVGHQVHMVYVDDVLYFESDSKYTRVVAHGSDGLIRTPLKDLLEQLESQQFLQTHRSVLVNRRFIKAVHRRGDAMEIELRDRPERLKVSTANQHLLRSM